MKRYLLEIADAERDWDRTISAVVYANSEEEAREALFSYTLDEFDWDLSMKGYAAARSVGPQWWRDPERSTATEIPDEPGVVHTHFNAG